VIIKEINRSPLFIKQTKHLDKFLLSKLRIQIKKILDNSEIGKPLKYKRGERGLYIKPFRLIYVVKGEEIILLKFEHRKSVYK
jgi:mRNA-degrading endonuclease RelE of RelBE toxin-antitoxin system